MKTRTRRTATLRRLALVLLGAAMAAGGAGCGGRDEGSGGAAASNPERVPMLPGAGAAPRDTDTPGGSSRPLAQRFAVPRDEPSMPASGALLPPVMHTAE
ncbi:hypothetical protein WKR88_17085 [Trinickia caryophylli]|uniref:Lipoprotein-attachment site-containing protein n=1 Tax=Trinickia caryophylli TaxID=28094 RepID=A0A1X7G2T3_TRICW|nr:hypothetical protein [Trinickia caryophylli]TRX14202.1 hypothetical protein FNF07_23110 [Trinickia caryophylli]WQE14026.1 hypothetical protein U0034_25320 [Trinickia caryophylli]GLU33488.1 hypothetical protein Busp01_33300 [Trinickia caryophylli]SMF62804.1 hypothetical protein SAMN06295900_11342 [Trinickia caryophylli]